MKALLDTNIFLEVILAQEKSDDAYQYAVARKYELTIVTFDADFQRTDKECKTPYQFLQNS